MLNICMNSILLIELCDKEEEENEQVLIFKLGFLNLRSISETYGITLAI